MAEKYINWTQRAEEFVDIYLRNGRNSYQAIIEMGGTPQQAKNMSARLLKRKKVKALLEKATSSVRTSIRITLEKKFEYLKKAVEACCDKNGNVIPKYIKDMTKVFEVLNKMEGHIAPTSSIALTAEIDSNQPVKDRLIDEILQQYEKDM